MVVVIVVAVTIGITVSAVGSASDALENTYSNYMMNVAQNSANTVDAMMEARAKNFSGGVGGEFIEDNLLTALKSDPEGKRESMSDTFEILNEVRLEGVEGSYACFVSKNGLIMYHPTLEKIGTEAENEAVKGLVQRLSSGEKPDQIQNASMMITSDIEELRSANDGVNLMCTDNSATTQELAAAMEETSATTEIINGSIMDMQESAGQIESLTVSGDDTQLNRFSGRMVTISCRIFL